MEIKKVKINSRRIFSEEFKKSRVNEYERGKFSVKELGDLFQIEEAVIYRWIYRYSSYNKKRVKVVEMEESATKKVKELQQRIRELERIVGLKQINIDLLEKMIDLAKSDYGFDVKKNCSIPPLSGSGATKDKKGLK